jgi:HSP20 family molecular chaperone IbpA
MASNFPANYSGHHHHHSPAIWNKTPYGYGGESTSMMPFVNPGTGFDMSRAMANPMGFMDNMSRAMADPTNFDRTVRSMEHAMQREMMGMQREMEHMIKNVDRTYTSDLVHQPSRPASVMEHYSLMNPIRCDVEGNRWLNCCFDLRTFKPEEIAVTLNAKERCINVEANHEVRDSKDHYIKRHYARKFFLPENINADLAKLELKSCLNNEGLLSIEAALPKITPEEASRMALTTPSTFSVPITVKHI